MNELPAVVKRVWLVDGTGCAVVKTEPPAKLTSGQRHYRYRLGLLAVDTFLKENGFRSNALESATNFSYEKCQVLIDIVLKKPDNIAYVTSYAGYAYDKESIRAKVVTARDLLGSDLVIQIMISTMDSAGTRKPIFIPLAQDLADPGRYVLKTVLGTLASACENIAKVKDAFATPKIQSAQNQALPEGYTDV